MAIRILGCVLAIFILAPESWGQALDLPALIDRHEKGVQLLERFDTVVSVKQVSVDGNTANDPLWTIRWSQEGSKSRQRHRNDSSPTQDEKGNPTNVGDIYVDGEFLYEIANWDLSKSKVIPDRYLQGLVKAWKRPHSPEARKSPYNVAAYFALIEIQSGPTDEPRTLREFVAKSPKATYSGEVEMDGRKLHRIEMLHPDTRNQKYFRNCNLELFLDPDAGYMIRRLKLQGSKDGSLKRPEMEIETVVLEFKKEKNGSFFPVKTETSSRYPDFSSKVSMEATKLTLNTPLPKDALDFAFPENAVVTFDNIDGIKRQAFLWGADNKPVKQIREFDDLPPLEPPSSQNRGSTLIVLGTLLALLVLGGFLYRRFRQNA